MHQSIYAFKQQEIASILRQGYGRQALRSQRRSRLHFSQRREKHAIMTKLFMGESLLYPVFVFIAYTSLIYYLCYLFSLSLY